MNNYQEVVFGKLDLIKELRLNGEGVGSIFKALGISQRELCFFISDAEKVKRENDLDELHTTNKKDLDNIISNNNGKEVKLRDLYIQFNRVWDIEGERAGMVEDALFKSCFDHTVKYKTISKKDGSIVEVEQVIPASYNAQRFFLINRAPKKWQNENKEQQIDKDKPIQQIAVKFIDPNSEPSAKRVQEMMNDILNEKKEQ